MSKWIADLATQADAAKGRVPYQPTKHPVDVLAEHARQRTLRVDAALDELAERARHAPIPSEQMAQFQKLHLEASEDTKKFRRQRLLNQARSQKVKLTPRYKPMAADFNSLRGTPRWRSHSGFGSDVDTWNTKAVEDRVKVHDRGEYHAKPTNVTTMFSSGARAAKDFEASRLQRIADYTEKKQKRVFMDALRNKPVFLARLAGQRKRISDQKKKDDTENKKWLESAYVEAVRENIEEEIQPEKKYGPIY